MLKEELEIELARLREKWQSFPKSYNDPRWWNFRMDKLKAENLKTQIKKIEAGIEITAGDMTEDQVKEIFTS